MEQVTHSKNIEDKKNTAESICEGIASFTRRRIFIVDKFTKKITALRCTCKFRLERGNDMLLVSTICEAENDETGLYVKMMESTHSISKLEELGFPYIGPKILESYNELVNLTMEEWWDRYVLVKKVLSSNICVGFHKGQVAFVLIKDERLEKMFTFMDGPVNGLFDKKHVVLTPNMLGDSFYSDKALPYGKISLAVLSDDKIYSFDARCDYGRFTLMGDLSIYDDYLGLKLYAQKSNKAKYIYNTILAKLKSDLFLDLYEYLQT